MPGLKDLLKKKERLARSDDSPEATQPTPDVPRFTFIRTTTNTEEIIEPPTYPEDTKENHRNRSLQNLTGSAGRKHSSASSVSSATSRSSQQLPLRTKGERRLSDRLHLHRRSRSASAEPSIYLPADLPEAPEAVQPRPKTASLSGEDKDADEQREAQWEKRATMLAKSSSPSRDARRSRSPSISASDDESVQRAIALHEQGDLRHSTELFTRLANPSGANNALAQIMAGLAFRHGWGVATDPDKAIHYLQLAVSNSASIEEQALASGMKKGGAAKGELILAMYELGNSLYLKGDKGAIPFLETSANLGDPDAMERLAWCWLEGFGGQKDKFKAAQYFRLAESRGHKIVGNSWIWKPKYDPK